MHRLLLLSLLAPATALAVPMAFTHQGRLLDSGGAPLDGDHSVTLNLYDDVSDTTADWTETHATVTFEAGYFQVQVGSEAALDSALIDGRALYLGIAIDGGSELTDRLAIVSVPYAVRAETATHVSGGSVDATEIRINGNVVIGSDGTVSGGSDTLADLSCNEGQVAKMVSGSWTCADDAYNTDASALDTGKVDPQRLTFGGGATDIAPGNHTHDFADIQGTLTIAQIPMDDVKAAITPGDIGAAPAGAGVVVGGSGETCDAAGKLRFVSGALQVCDGTDWVEVTSGSNARASCQEHLDAGLTADGVYPIDLDGPGGLAAFDVYCDQTTAGGGWMRFTLETRQWGNNQGFGTDPIASTGTRVAGANSQLALDDLTGCTGDSQVAMVWTSEGTLMTGAHLTAINTAISETSVGEYHIYDADGGDDWDQIKGCAGGTVVMTGDGSELGAGANRTWIGPYAVDTFTGLFDTGFYGGNSDNNGYNASLQPYWFVR